MSSILQKPRSDTNIWDLNFMTLSRLNILHLSVKWTHKKCILKHSLGIIVILDWVSSSNYVSTSSIDSFTLYAGILPLDTCKLNKSQSGFCKFTTDSNCVCYESYENFKFKYFNCDIVAKNLTLYNYSVKTFITTS